MLLQRNKVDISKLSTEDRKLFEKYGKLPTAINERFRGKDRKYFDSGDYALSKAGVAPQSTVGTAIPNPENIPHTSSSGNGHNGQKPISISPTNSMSSVGKESGLANDENTIPKPEQLRYGEEAVADAILKSERRGSGIANVENTIFKSGSVEETVAGSGLANDENITPKSETTETTENEATGQGSAR